LGEVIFSSLGKKSIKERKKKKKENRKEKRKKGSRERKGIEGKGREERKGREGKESREGRKEGRKEGRLDMQDCFCPICLCTFLDCNSNQAKTASPDLVLQTLG
jgi:hypothetical protein